MAEKVVETQREPTSISIAAPEMHEDTIDSSNNYDKSQSNVEDFVVLGKCKFTRDVWVRETSKFPHPKNIRFA